VINSAQNPRIQHVRALVTRRKAREEAGEFVIEGVRLVEEAEDSSYLPNLILFTQGISPRGKDILIRLESRGCSVEEIPYELMSSLSDTKNSQGILAVVPFPNIPIVDPLTFIVVADSIRDPGNIGTLLRSAAAVGVEMFILTPGTTDPFSPKVVRSAMGAHFRLPIREYDWSGIRSEVVKNTAPPLKAFLADMDGKSLWEADFTKPLALIIGGEAEGASSEGRGIADTLVSIPMPGGAESLNAAVAGSILLFEILRQRQK
jgi:TrmH family RNA methyltransferase